MGRWKRRWSHAIAAAAAVVMSSTQLPAQSAAVSVSFRALDGRPVAGFMMEASVRPAPGVVLVPMLGRPKDEWAGVAQRLAQANITALAIDLPGYYLPPGAAAATLWHTDVLAATAFLAARPDVRRDAIGIAGASLGANLAAVAAAADPQVRALALVSPSLNYRGVAVQAPMVTYGARPALLVASLQDPYAARTVRELASEAPGPREVIWSEMPAHGTILLGQEPDLVRLIVEWFQRTLL